MATASSSLLPLAILLLLLTLLALVGFAAYGIATSVADQTRGKMERRHVSFTKDGMKVGVREMGAEKQRDRTQRFVFSLGEEETAGMDEEGVRGWGINGEEKGDGWGGEIILLREKEIGLIVVNFLVYSSRLGIYRFGGKVKKRRLLRLVEATRGKGEGEF
ncbi:MAG: hypothetical protein LQ343_003945 [Gyalolechia ehrenbergii]|nr:MAG: hypothetical protein LQ343_003945 [Gyalolechia ehrenbergii]